MRIHIGLTENEMISRNSWNVTETFSNRCWKDGHFFDLWTHGPELPDKYFDFINGFRPSLRFSIDRSDITPHNQIAFLDTLITVKESGSYLTELYMKPMAAPIILHFTSNHPMQMKRSVLRSQSLRAIRLGSDTAAQKRGLKKIEVLFLENGFPLNLIRNIQNS